MGVSENTGTPKSSILIGFSITNHPFWQQWLGRQLAFTLLLLSTPRAEDI